MVNDWRTGRHCVFKNYVHLVFVRKYRKKVFTQNIKELEKKLWGDNLWTHSYCAVSCGGAPLEVVKKYVENQKIPGIGGKI